MSVHDTRGDFNIIVDGDLPMLINLFVKYNPYEFLIFCIGLGEKNIDELVYCFL